MKRFLRWYLVFFIVLACSRPGLNILAIMDNDNKKLIVINRNDFTLTDADVFLNNTYRYNIRSITAGERYSIILGDLIDDRGVSFSLARSEYRTFTVDADQGYMTGAWKK